MVRSLLALAAFASNPNLKRINSSKGLAMDVKQELIGDKKEILSTTHALDSLIDTFFENDFFGASAPSLLPSALHDCCYSRNLHFHVTDALSTPCVTPLHEWGCTSSRSVSHSPLVPDCPLLWDTFGWHPTLTLIAPRRAHHFPLKYCQAYLLEALGHFHYHQLQTLPRSSRLRTTWPCRGQACTLWGPSHRRQLSGFPSLTSFTITSRNPLSRRGLAHLVSSFYEPQLSAPLLFCLPQFFWDSTI
ncbi:hypothetical protein PVK06_033196 [Gossypium arboreum]|uniref:Uncharacterized protein n=1 Tax=Gossypium arboreum TaxID=29729 RepID=A0ABR0NAQ9_GOSAR|nr:hypothetical protein PVK06_033196 [Gossypium arboreum]